MDCDFLPGITRKKFASCFPPLLRRIHVQAKRRLDIRGAFWCVSTTQARQVSRAAHRDRSDIASFLMSIDGNSFCHACRLLKRSNPHSSKSGAIIWRYDIFYCGFVSGAGLRLKKTKPSDYYCKSVGGIYFYWLYI